MAKKQKEPKGEALPEAPTGAIAQVWERRLVNPLQSSVADVNIKDGENWELHWVDTGRQGRFYQATRQQGWVPVRSDELEESLDILGLTDGGDGSVRRGIKGQEILMKIPKKVFTRIRKRKAEINQMRMKKTREHLAQSAATRFGDKAADFVMGKGDLERDGTGGLKGEIIDSHGELPVE